jgi:hypothetical protein
MQLTKVFISLVIATSLSNPLAQAASVPLVVQLASSTVEVSGKTIKLSPYYQVVLEFPQPIDLVGGNNTNLFKVTVPEDPQDRYLLLDALSSSGIATINVITGGKVLPLTLVIDGKSKFGTRKYVFVDSDAVTNPVASTATASVGTRLAALPALDSNAQTARDNFLAALKQLDQLKAQRLAASHKIFLRAQLVPGEQTDTLKLTVQNAGEAAVALGTANLQVWVSGKSQQVNVEDLQVEVGETRVLAVDLGLKLKANEDIKVIWPVGEGVEQFQLQTSLLAK